MHCCGASVLGFPSVWTAPCPHSRSFSSLGGSYLIRTFFLKHLLTSPTLAGTSSAPTSVIPETLFRPLAHIHLFFQKGADFLCTKHYSKKLVGDAHNEINLKIFIKCLECARCMLGTEETLAAVYSEFGSSYFEFTLYHIISLSSS